MTVKVFTSEEEMKKFFGTAPDKLRQVNKYLAKISESLERARRTQTEIRRLKKRTEAVLAKLP